MPTKLNLIENSAIGLLLLLTIWLATGTLAPYANTTEAPLSLTRCHYLFNQDHPHFLRNFLMLDGAPRALWQEGILLRRILLPLLSYPFMHAFGFELGGVMTNGLIHLLTLFALIQFLQKSYGKTAGLWGGLFFASYPGMSYWVGTPYSYAGIVPACTLLFILLSKMDSEAARNSRKIHFWISITMGVLFLTYDLFPYFGLPACYLIYKHRASKYAWLNVGITMGLLALPNLMLSAYYHYLNIPLVTANTQIYLNILNAVSHVPDWTQWLVLLKRFPYYALRIILFSNFCFLPITFGLVALGQCKGWTPRFNRVEKSILVITSALLLFNNLIPPYPGWQMRGPWIARLYQPVFIVFFSYLSRSLGAAQWRQSAWGKVLILCGALTILFNLAICVAPSLGSSFSNVYYERFYQHGPRNMMSKNLEIYGRRPLGFCK